MMDMSRKRDDYILPDFGKTAKVLSRPDQHLEKALLCLHDIYLTDSALATGSRWLKTMRDKQTKWFLAETPQRLARAAAMRSYN